MQRLDSREEVEDMGMKSNGVQDGTSFPNEGQQINSTNEYQGSLFETPQSLMSSPQYEIFSSPFRGQFSGRGPALRCAFCNKDIQGPHPQFACSHNICAHCFSMTDGRKCLICSTSVGIPTQYPPNMFLSPTQTDHPTDVADSSVSLHNQSISSYQNGLCNTLQNMTIGFNDLSTVEPFNLWDNKNKIAVHATHLFEKIKGSQSLPSEELPPVFSPVSPGVDRFPMPPVSSGRSLPHCAACGIDARAESFCANCRELLCADCVIAHQRVRITRDHMVISLQQLLSHMQASPHKDESLGAGSDDSSPRPSSVCSTHEAPIVCSCESCAGAALCAHCLSIHAAHQLVPIGDLRSSVAVLLAEWKHNEKNIDEAIESVRRMGERVDASVQAVASELRSVMHLHISALEERKRELLQSVDTIRQSKMKALKMQGEKLISRKAAVAQTIKSVEPLGDEDDARLVHAFEELVKLYSPPLFLSPHETDLIKFVTPDNQLLTQIRCLGDLESGPCARVSHIIGEGYKRAIRERQCIVYVQLRDACGNISTSNDNDVTATMIGPDGHQLEVHIGEREAGVVAIGYLPVMDGKHQLNVLVRGVAISGCPVAVEVRRGRNYTEIGMQGELFSFGKEGKFQTSNSSSRPCVCIWAGSGDGELCRPWGICIDLRGRVLVADRSNNRIQIFDKDGVFLSKFGSSGTRPGQFDRPAGVATNTRNNIIVADKDNHRIQVFDENGHFLLKFGERGRPIGMFNYPWGVATNMHNHIAVSDTRNHRVQIFNENGQFMRKCGFDTAFFYKHLDSPRGLCYLPDGQLLITDFNNHRLAVLSSRNAPEMKVYGSEGDVEGMFCRPQGVKIDPEGRILVCDSRNNRIQVFAGDDMRCVAVFGHAPAGFEMPAELPTPFQSAAPPSMVPFLGSVGGSATQSTRQLLDRPTDVAISADGRVYVVDFGNNCIRVF
uniref:B box-type domain-containing protein n=1 Tax=Heterorhabditis bacteriophora TaxID=37862 RepID=A0A1I7XNS5_HETBA